MKASELRAYLEKIILEFGDLDVAVFLGDNTRLREISNLSRAGIDKPISDQKIWIEI